MNQLATRADTNLSTQSPGKHISAELARLGAVYGKTLSKEDTRLLNATWAEIFGDLPPDMLHKAVKEFIATDTKGFFPVPGQIMAIVKKMQQPKNGDRKDGMTYYDGKWVYI